MAGIVTDLGRITHRYWYETFSLTQCDPPREEYLRASLSDPNTGYIWCGSRWHLLGGLLPPINEIEQRNKAA